MSRLDIYNDGIWCEDGLPVWVPAHLASRGEVGAAAVREDLVDGFHDLRVRKFWLRPGILTDEPAEDDEWGGALWYECPRGVLGARPFWRVDFRRPSTRPRLKCPWCGKVLRAPTLDFVPKHKTRLRVPPPEWSPYALPTCPGSRQNPRAPEDRRPLWSDRDGEARYEAWATGRMVPA